MSDASAPSPILDVHAHVFAPGLIAAREAYCQRDRWFGLLYANPRARLASAPDLITAMDEAGVGQAVVFGFAFADQGLCRAANDYVFSAAQQYPQRLLPMALVNPRAGAAALSEARRALEAGAVGLGELMPDGQGFDLTDFVLLEPLMALARAYRTPIMLHVNEPVGHTYAGKGAQGPQPAFELAARFPENVLILSHWGGGLPFYELMPEARVALRNVYYDTAASPYLYEDAIFRHVLAWAPHKVLWGSDYPLLGLKRCLRHLRGAGLDAASWARVTGGNARALLAL